jgi:alpha-1,6-mannosyltransferase
MASESPHADTVVGVSADSLMAIPELHQNKGRIIYGPVDRNRLAPVTSAKAMRESLGLEPTTKVLLYFGRISPEKRVERAIDAMRYMPDDWRLLVVGGSSGLIDPAILYNNFKVQFCGPTLTPGDYLQIADCTISPSNLEGFGLSVIEAMVSGKPTVAHKVGILQELDVGTILPMDATPSQYAAAVLRATKDADKASRDQAILSSMFTVESFIDQWISIL